MENTINEDRVAYFVRRKELVEASKAIYDEVLYQVKSYLEAKIKDWGKELETKYAGQIEALHKTIQSMVDVVKAIPSPHVDVHVPPPRLTEKSFTYDGGGRPATVIEREVKE